MSDTDVHVVPMTDARFEGALVRTAARYEKATTKRWDYHFARGKLRADPVTMAVAELGPLGEVLDLGCGRGQLSLMLLELGNATHVRGSDWDAAKVHLARRAAEGLPAAFTVQDAGLEADLGEADTVMLIDVLHYLDAATQDALLERAARAVRPGGRLLLREASTGYGARSTFTRAVERLSRAVGLNVGASTTIRDVGTELGSIVERQGLRWHVRPCWGGTWFANVLLVGTRPRPADERATPAVA